MEEVQKMKRTITVKGTGHVSARPDYITLALSLTAADMEYEKAMEDGSRRIGLLEDAARRAGFAKGDLKTISFHVNTQYESVPDRNGTYQRRFAGYACVYRLKLAFDFDSGRLAAVLAAIADSKADPELNISFSLRDPAAVGEELLAGAAASARAKAEVLCRASGVELGQLLSIDYNWDELSILSRTRFEMEDSVVPMMAAKSRALPEMEPDDIDLSDTACFVWEIQ